MKGLQKDKINYRDCCAQLIKFDCRKSACVLFELIVSEGNKIGKYWENSMLNRMFKLKLTSLGVENLLHLVKKQQKIFGQWIKPKE